jgi:hypothetical protein
MIHTTSAAMIPRTIQVDVDIELAPLAAVAAILADRRGGVSSPRKNRDAPARPGSLGASTAKMDRRAAKC